MCLCVWVRACHGSRFLSQHDIDTVWPGGVWPGLAALRAREPKGAQFPSPLHPARTDPLPLPTGAFYVFLEYFDLPALPLIARIVDHRDATVCSLWWCCAGCCCCNVVADQLHVMRA